MIQPNELRIGNWVLFPNVFAEFDQRPIESGEEIDRHAHGLNPIPLTEEWLLKFGFEISTLSNGVKFIYLNYFLSLVICESCSGMHLVLSRYENGSLVDFAVRVHYVHQLQNLFFALTGKELELKKEMA